MRGPRCWEGLGLPLPRATVDGGLTSQRRVEPWMSVKTSVTNPVGAGAGRAALPAVVLERRAREAADTRGLEEAGGGLADEARAGARPAAGARAAGPPRAGGRLVVLAAKRPPLLCMAVGEPYVGGERG